jgi:hypothetical protein
MCTFHRACPPLDIVYPGMNHDMDNSQIEKALVRKEGHP